jgi:hypothetical protein
MPTLTSEQKAVLAAIPYDTPIKAAEIAREVGASDRDHGHSIRPIIRELRLMGFPIVSDTSRGFWKTVNPCALAEFAQSLYHRASEIELVAAKMLDLAAHPGEAQCVPEIEFCDAS